jgi:cold shock CspA family protein
MTTGTVKWINDSKGFVTPDSGGKDLFARFWTGPAENSNKALKQKQKVSFEVTGDLDGEQAANIKPIA